MKTPWHTMLIWNLEATLEREQLRHQLAKRLLLPQAFRTASWSSRKIRKLIQATPVYHSLVQGNPLKSTEGELIPQASLRNQGNHRSPKFSLQIIHRQQRLLIEVWQMKPKCVLSFPVMAMLEKTKSEHLKTEERQDLGTSKKKKNM